MDRLVRGRPVLVPGHGGLAPPVRPRRGPGRGDGRAAGRRAAPTAQAYNVMGEDVVSQVGLRRADRGGDRPAGTLRTSTPRLLKARQAGRRFGQNLVYDCHAVHTTTKLRAELGLRPRYSLHAGLAQTWEWYCAKAWLERPSTSRWRTGCSPRSARDARHPRVLPRRRPAPTPDDPAPSRAVRHRGIGGHRSGGGRGIARDRHRLRLGVPASLLAKRHAAPWIR